MAKANLKYTISANWKTRTYIWWVIAKFKLTGEMPCREVVAARMFSLMTKKMESE